MILQRLLYDILLGGRISLKLTSSECEKLELALLALEDIKVEEDIIVSPIKVCLDKAPPPEEVGIKNKKEVDNLEYGPVIITDGQHKGRIGMYDDEDEDASGETLAIVYFGSMFSVIRYEFIPFEYLSDQITTPALMNRVNEIYRELWKKPYDLVFQNDRLNELYLCSNLLENRYKFTNTMLSYEKGKNKRARKFITLSFIILLFLVLFSPLSDNKSIV